MTSFLDALCGSGRNQNLLVFELPVEIKINGLTDDFSINRAC